MISQQQLAHFMINNTWTWRSQVPDKLSAYKDLYKQSFPVKKVLKNTCKFKVWMNYRNVSSLKNMENLLHLEGHRPYSYNLLSLFWEICLPCPPSRWISLPVGGRLKHFVKAWEQITDDQWILSTIRDGLKLEFLTMPPFSGIKQTVVNAQDLPILLQEVEKLLEKNPQNLSHGKKVRKIFIQHFLLVPKKSGELRPVINLRPLSRYLRKQHYKMDCLDSSWGNFEDTFLY